ncbi:MAG: hypothetical protein ACI3XQ_00920, partial [Eubacteriales bacterium]
MKTATPFIKTVSVILLVCTLFSMCILTTSAEESTTAPENWKIDNGDTKSYADGGWGQYYTDPGFEYVYFYKNLLPDSEKNDKTPSTLGFYSDFTVDGSQRQVPSSTLCFFEGNCFSPQYHFALGVSYTCPYTGIIKFSFDYALADSNHQLLIGFKNSFSRSAWDYFNDAKKRYDYVDSELHSSTMEFRVEKGDVIYFI